jgi:hypothetical protein
MAIRKVRLTEAELTRLIKNIVTETQAEMEEGWLEDKFKDVKRYTTGYGDEGEKKGAEKRFFEKLDELESEVLEDIENYRYEDESGWEEAKERIIGQAEDNNFMGELKMIYPRETNRGRFMPGFVNYIKGESRAKTLMGNLGSGAAGATRSYQSKAQSNESRFNRRRLR